MMGDPISICRSNGIVYYSKGYMDAYIKVYWDENTELMEENEELITTIQKLKDYAHHREPCRKSNWDFDEVCTCGLDNILEERDKVLTPSLVVV